MPPKPTLDMDMAEFRHMRSLMIKVQDKAREIKHLQDKVLPQLKQQIADTKAVSYTHLDVYKRQRNTFPGLIMMHRNTVPPSKRPR